MASCIIQYEYTLHSNCYYLSAMQRHCLPCTHIAVPKHVFTQCLNAPISSAFSVYIDNASKMKVYIL